MKNMNKTAFAIGTSLVVGLASTATHAMDNPFALSELSAGYMNLAEADVAQDDAAMKMKDGSCGEGKCGAQQTEQTEETEKSVEGKCGSQATDESVDDEGVADDATDDKSSEGKCGANK